MASSTLRTENKRYFLQRKAAGRVGGDQVGCTDVILCMGSGCVDYI